MRKEISGGWINLRDPKKVPERLRRPLLVMTAEVLSKLDGAEEGKVDAAQLTFMSEFNDLLSIAMIDEWSFDAPISIDSMLDLAGSSYDEIRQIVSPYVSELMPDFGPSQDPKVITAD